MTTDRDFPQALVGERAKELREAWMGSWEPIARLSLRREYEACEPLVKELNDASAAVRAHAIGCVRCQNEVDHIARVISAHRARYAPEPPKPEKPVTLAEAVESYIRLWPEHGDALRELREALARERAK